MNESSRGIIPARAGFTTPTRSRSSPVTDHPRSRGVYTHPRPDRRNVTGSSPLARGLRLRGIHSRSEPRIIPARAGFTWGGWRGGRWRRDHPRSRGVYGLEPGRKSRNTGSSPLARGLHGHPRRGGRGLRIIPARAGFTCGRRPARAGTPDHPRSRGVYLGGGCEHGRTEGSSPLARGLRWIPAGWSHARGIIPARAGFTVNRAAHRLARRDHPRSRGVYGRSERWRCAHLGSSPLARGLPVHFDSQNPGGGIIPARAGFTRRPVDGPAGRGDHPRSRGVYATGGTP